MVKQVMFFDTLFALVYRPAAPQASSHLMASLESGTLVRPLMSTARSKSVTTLTSSNSSVIRSALQGACSGEVTSCSNDITSVEMTSGSCSAEMTGGSGSNDDDGSDPMERMREGDKGTAAAADAESCIDSGIVGEDGIINRVGVEEDERMVTDD